MRDLERSLFRLLFKNVIQFTQYSCTNLCTFISGNFLIYCSMLPPFKEALSKICAFLCFWKFWRPNSEFNHDSEIEAININERTPFTTTTSASNNTRHAVVVHHREMVPGEPPKTARVLKLFSKRRRGHSKEKTRPEPEGQGDNEMMALTSLTNGHQDQAEQIITRQSNGDVVVQVTIENQSKQSIRYPR